MRWKNLSPESLPLSDRKIPRARTEYTWTVAKNFDRYSAITQGASPASQLEKEFRGHGPAPRTCHRLQFHPVISITEIHREIFISLIFFSSSFFLNE